MSNKIYDIPVRRIDGTETSLGEFKGKALLLVNVASKCGLTPQYSGLESLYREYKDKGFEVLGFPANNFAGQEPGTNEEIKDFCTSNYEVTFPLFEKISVKGEDRHPLYTFLTEEKSSPDISDGNAFEQRLEAFGSTRENPSDLLWNFEKFVIGRDGTVAARIDPDITVDDERVKSVIEAELNK